LPDEGPPDRRDGGSGDRDGDLITFVELIPDA
jgi:hypothetical protein